MSNLNEVILAGICGTEPEQREFENGSKVTKFSIGVNRWNKREEKEVTDWINIETFSKLGDYVTKGMKVVVKGSLLTNVYQTEDGKNIKKVYVLANHLELMQRKDTPEPEQRYGTQEYLGGNSDYPEDENTVIEEVQPTTETTMEEDEIPF